MKSLIALAVAALIAAAPAFGQPRDDDDDDPPEYKDRSDYRDAYRRGYERGFERGYQRGLKEGERRAPVVAPAPPPPPVLGPIRVTSAQYGSRSRSCDATRWVRRHVDGKRIASFKVSNEMCGDPDHGDRKTLEVAFRCGEVVRGASAREHQTIYLNCN